MRDERRKEERSKQGQTNNKAQQHSTPKAVTFPKKNELPRVGLEPMTLYMYMYIHVHVIVAVPRQDSMSPARIKAVCLDTATITSQEVESEVGTNSVLIVCYMYIHV